MDKFSKIMLVFISFILLSLLILNVQERIQREQVAKSIREDLIKSIMKLEKERLNVYEVYLEDLVSEETKSVYHQIFHASNAQLRMLDIIAQENELLISLISKK